MNKKVLPVGRRGFTLVELMIVVSIITILSIVGLTVFSGVQNQAKYAKVAADFHAMSINIGIARIAQHQTLGQITKSAPLATDWCAECNSCRSDPKSVGCLNEMKDAYSKVTSAPLPIDPWGDPYMWDENEGDPFLPTPSPGPCGMTDIIESAGPDRIWGIGSIHGADNVLYNVQRSGFAGCAI